MEPQPPIPTTETISVSKKSFFGKPINFIYAALVITIIGSGVFLAILRAMPKDNEEVHFGGYNSVPIVDGYSTQTDANDPYCTVPYDTDQNGKDLYHTQKVYRGHIRTDMPVRIVLSCDSTTFTITGAVTQTIMASDFGIVGSSGEPSFFQGNNNDRTDMPVVFGTTGDYNSDGYNDLLVWDGTSIQSEDVFTYVPNQKKFTLMRLKEGIPLSGGYIVDADHTIYNDAGDFNENMPTFILKKDDKVIATVPPLGLDGYSSILADFKDYVVFTYRSRGYPEPTELTLVEKTTGKDVLSGEAPELISVDSDHGYVLYSTYYSGKKSRASDLVVFDTRDGIKTYFNYPKELTDAFVEDPVYYYNSKSNDFSEKKIVLTMSDDKIYTIYPIPTAPAAAQ